MATGHVVGGYKQFVGRKFGGAIEIDRIGGLVGGEGNDLFDIIGDGRGDYVFSTVDIGLDTFHGIVFCSRNLFQGCCVNNEIHPAHSLVHTVLVAHVTQKIPH